MKNQTVTFQQFIKKIKTIEVSKLIDEAKKIKVKK
tara:strand:+ start:787 stop:891 length:105 start_codon:yes stop_codon:yes gene_type:complete